MIAIVNYGMGNLVSIQNAVDYLGFESKIVSDPFELSRFNRVILPGVGSFYKASQILSSSGFSNELRNFALKGKPVLGICLGMQLLATYGDEGGGSEGLDLIPGKVIPFDPQEAELIPFVGFQEVFLNQNNSGIWKDHHLKESFYFTHSFRFQPDAEANISSTACNGKYFCASIEKENVFGVQFHPELSQTQGLKLMRNFLNL